MSKTDKTEPMDAGAPEGDKPSISTNQSRVAYALVTLVREVHALFPETPVEYGDIDGRNTALSATFDATVLDSDVRGQFEDLIHAVHADPRVAEVTSEDDLVYVRLYSRATTQDNRNSFDLGDIWLSMSEEHEGSTLPSVASDEPDALEEHGTFEVDL